jgi:hypothetical protein
MDGRIALLGRPRIECRGRAVPLAGRKPWGLLAYLCLEHQATRGYEIGDPCWEALALRGLALIAQRDRRAGQARDLLTEAVACCRRLSDVYRRAEVVVLTDLLELDPAPDEAETARALRLATAGPMPDLFERLRNRSKLQTPTLTGGR